MVNYIKNLVRDEDGVTAVEYAVLAVLIIAAVVAAMTAFSPALTGAFTNVANKATSATL